VIGRGVRGLSRNSERERGPARSPLKDEHIARRIRWEDVGVNMR
jgi:hypothetical protein